MKGDFLSKWIIITCSKRLHNAYKMYSHGLSHLHLTKSLLKEVGAARKGQRWDDSTFLQYLRSKAPACGSVCQVDSISLAVVIVVSNKPVQRLEWHQVRDEIINVTNSLCAHVESGRNWMGSKLINDYYVNNKHLLRTSHQAFYSSPPSHPFFYILRMRKWKVSITKWLLQDPTAT